MKRSVGFILLVLGLILLALGVKPVHEQIVKSMPQLGGIDPIVLLGIGVALLVIGIIIMKGASSGKQAEEVPIYHGKEIVGYRRLVKGKR